MESLVIGIPPQGLEKILAEYTLKDFSADISQLADPEGMLALKGGARIRVEYYTALLRYTAARCARAAAGGYDSSGGGTGPTMPRYYLQHSMGDALNEDLVANEWKDLQKMCPHLMGWDENGDGTETCNGCKVTVVSKTKYDKPEIVETPPKPRRSMVVGASYDCPLCHRRHPAGPCSNFTGCPPVDTTHKAEDPQTD